MRPKVLGVCSVCGAEGKIRDNGMCVKDYMAYWREKTKQIKCKVEGCERGCKARMMCENHYRRYMIDYKRKNSREMLDRVAAEAERRRIVAMLEKYGHRDAARIVSLIGGKK